MLEEQNKNQELQKTITSTYEIIKSISMDISDLERRANQCGSDCHKCIAYIKECLYKQSIPLASGELIEGDGNKVKLTGAYPVTLARIKDQTEMQKKLICDSDQAHLLMEKEKASLLQLIDVSDTKLSELYQKNSANMSKNLELMKTYDSLLSQRKGVETDINQKLNMIRASNEHAADEINQLSSRMMKECSERDAEINIKTQQKMKDELTLQSIITSLKNAIEEANKYADEFSLKCDKKVGEIQKVCTEVAGIFTDALESKNDHKQADAQQINI